MSLLNLLHKSVIIKFGDAAKHQFDPEASYVFRLAGVDAMGFLQIQELKPTAHAGLETALAPYWINKDLVREIHEFDAVKAKESASENGETAKSQAQSALEQVRRDVAPKPAKTKLPTKPKTALKQKPVLN